MNIQVVIDNCIAKWDDMSSDTRATHARRIFHGRGHCFEGLEHIVVTWLPPYVLIGVYAPVQSDQLQRLVDELVEHGPGIEGLAVQFRDGRRTQTETMFGEVPEEHQVSEAGLKFWVMPKRNQNIGLFLDMSHVRAHLTDYMRGARVLNLFAYTCAFSVAALDQGAEQVVNNDMSKNSLAQGTRNHEANGHDLRRVRMLPHNVFKSWWKIRQFGPYDVLIIDPPTNQRGSFNAEKNYGQVLKRIPELANPGAQVIACLNSPFLDQDFLQQQMARWSPQCQLIDALPPHVDFPDRYPERGLKVLHYAYRP
jgi:23S rRNA (cytosine1962-C5)-methyltransferase